MRPSCLPPAVAYAAKTPDVCSDRKGEGPSSHGWAMAGNVTLWQFLLELLRTQNLEHIIAWTTNEEHGEFKLIDAEEVARLWGLKKNKTNMNYDKLSRALRYYYDKGIIRKVMGQKFVYRFEGSTKGDHFGNCLDEGPPSVAYYHGGLQNPPNNAALATGYPAGQGLRASPTMEDSNDSSRHGVHHGNYWDSARSEVSSESGSVCDYEVNSLRRTPQGIPPSRPTSTPTPGPPPTSMAMPTGLGPPPPLRRLIPSPPNGVVGGNCEPPPMTMATPMVPWQSSFQPQHQYAQHHQQHYEGVHYHGGYDRQYEQQPYEVRNVPNRPPSHEELRIFYEEKRRKEEEDAEVERRHQAEQQRLMAEEEEKRRQRDQQQRELSQQQAKPVEASKNPQQQEETKPDDVKPQPQRRPRVEANIFNFDFIDQLKKEPMTPENSAGGAGPGVDRGYMSSEDSEDVKPTDLSLPRVSSLDVHQEGGDKGKIGAGSSNDDKGPLSARLTPGFANFSIEAIMSPSPTGFGCSSSTFSSMSSSRRYGVEPLPGLPLLMSDGNDELRTPRVFLPDASASSGMKLPAPPAGKKKKRSASNSSSSSSSGVGSSGSATNKEDEEDDAEEAGEKTDEEKSPEKTGVSKKRAFPSSSPSPFEPPGKKPAATPPTSSASKGKTKPSPLSIDSIMAPSAMLNTPGPNTMSPSHLMSPSHYALSPLVFASFFGSLHSPLPAGAKASPPPSSPHCFAAPAPPVQPTPPPAHSNNPFHPHPHHHLHHHGLASPFAQSSLSFWSSLSPLAVSPRFVHPHHFQFPLPVSMTKPSAAAGGGDLADKKL